VLISEIKLRGQWRV